MATKPRSSEGCYTCRLRRKKCDEARPVCEGCAALEIKCLYSDSKPEWMDNGERQKLKAEEVKVEVKRNAAWRRERRYLQSIENGTEDLTLTTEPDGAHVHAMTSSNSLGRGPAVADLGDESGDEPGYHNDTSEASMSGITPVSSGEGHHATPGSSITSLSDIPSWWKPFRASLAQPHLGEDRELNFVLLYLDYIFPFLFPFYRPSLVSGGRGWLLVLMMNNKALFHSALSLAAYVFSKVLAQEAGEANTNLCIKHNWEELQKQQELSIKELQTAVQDINDRGVKGNVAESARVMESIIQLVCFEVALANTNDWQMHLEAAVVLFDQIMQHHSLSGEDQLPPWTQVLSQLEVEDPGPEVVRGHPHNSPQSALRFFSAVLLHMDIVASTTLNQNPRLQQYHHYILAPSKTCPSSPPAEPRNPRTYPLLNLEEFMGVQNWCLLSISAVSSLAAWKTQARRENKLSVLELVNRAAPIQDELGARIACLAARHQQTNRPFSTPVAGRESVGPFAAVEPAVDTDGPTLIWAQAAMSFLLVVVNGWQPESVEIRNSVDATVALFSLLPKAQCLRIVGWPVAVTGCLARREQEDVLRRMVNENGNLDMAGNVKEAMEIMESVWMRRAEIEASGGDWDLSRCFSALGRNAFFV